MFDAGFVLIGLASRHLFLERLEIASSQTLHDILSAVSFFPNRQHQTPLNGNVKCEIT